MSSNDKQIIKSHRLISSIDDNDNINGSMLIFNHKYSLKGIWQITDDIQIIEKHHSQEDAKALLSSYFFVTKKENGILEGYSSDGIFRKDLSNEILAKQIYKTTHFYDIINLDNSNL